MSVLRYCPDKRRVWVCGKRLHHGLVGAAFVSKAVVLFAVGAALAYHDRADFPWTKDND